VIYVFDPILKDNCFKKQPVDKLCRWASKLFAFKYVIEKILRDNLEFNTRRRVSLTDDGPAKVKPFKVHLKSDAVPRRARARKYAPKRRDWLIKHVKMLEKNGFIRKNPSSRWSSPVLIVLKPGKRGEFRMIVDCMYANSQVQPVPGFLPMLEMNFQHLENALGSRVLTLSRDSGISSGRGKSRGILFLDATWCVNTNTVYPGKH